MADESLSIIVPVFNEEENLPELRRRIAAFVASSGFAMAEVLLISDGSRDRSEEIIARIVEEDPLFVGLFLTRNFGHQAAVSLGLEQARGDIVAIIDGDLQDPPEAIGLLLKAIRSGADVAYGVRTARKENVIKRTAYFAFYRLLKRVSSIDIPLDTGDFCVMRRCVVNDMLRLPERQRFVRGLRAWVGYTQVGVTYERAARFAGAPKYTLRKLIALAYDGLFSFSGVPVRAMQFLGFAISGLAFITAAAYLLIAMLSPHRDWPVGWPTVVISIWLLAGVQLLFLGIVGEYVYRTFDESRRRPPALLRQRLEHPASLTSASTPQGWTSNPVQTSPNIPWTSSTAASTKIVINGTGGGARANAS